LDTLWSVQDEEAAIDAAAQAVAADPWKVVSEAGLLARCAVRVADVTVGLTAELRLVQARSSKAVAQIPAGLVYPVPTHGSRSKKGGFDTPQAMARDLVHRCFEARGRAAHSALDMACGAGTFLLALAEAGVQELHGTDVDPRLLRVARMAVPKAHLALRDGLEPGQQVDWVLGNPPFIPPELQDKGFRQRMLLRFPWLSGRFDAAVPFAAAALERVPAGGLVGLVLPASILVQPYGEPLRRHWLSQHRLVDFSAPERFPGVAVEVVKVLVEKNGRPTKVFHIAPGQWLATEGAVLRRDAIPLDMGILKVFREFPRRVADRFRVDTGVVVHGPGGGKATLISDQPGEGRVPFADAVDYFSGKTRYLNYVPDRMHRAKSPGLFERPKIVVQRLRGRGPIRASLDRSGVYVGHTCLVIQELPAEESSLERVLALLQHPLIDGGLRLSRGDRLDVYPRDLGSLPLPEEWDPAEPAILGRILGLTPAMERRLQELSFQGSVENA